MSENNKPQPKTKKQPPNTIGKPPKTEFINSEQQSKTPKSSDIN
ncbi:hypothetical protein [Nostoc sp. ChiQUE01b]|nr:hypothetical protein [Nostoc sp. ChiQUE01b]